MSNRRAWEIASRKYVDEDDAVFAMATSDDGTLLAVERALLARLLTAAPLVIHLQAGNAIDDFALVGNGASFVVGVDFSAVAATSAAGRAARAQLPAAYVAADAIATPLASGRADLVYTGKGSLVWLADLEGWATECFRLLRPGGALFVYDAHPLAALWTLDPSATGIVGAADYFGGTRVNTTFPASATARFGGRDAPAAVEHQWSLSATVSALLRAGFVLRHLGEHAEPFWRPADDAPPAKAWDGSLPNSLSILAERPPP